jgi:hypothetical protein
MNPLVMILLEAGLGIAKAHIKNALGGEVLGTTSFILDAAKAIDALHQEENGEPLDWSRIREHQPLAPSGEPPQTAPLPDGVDPEREVETITESEVGSVEDVLGDLGPEEPTLPGLENLGNPSQENPPE